MSLATRCTACGTVFRVVPDQLRVSGGWVRCGRCGEVFNAAEALVDPDAGASAPDSHRQRVLADLARLSTAASAPPDEPAPPGPLSRAAAAPADALPTPGPERSPGPPWPEAATDGTEPPDATGAVPAAPPAPTDADLAATSTAPVAPAAGDDLRADVRPERAAAATRPGFLRAAERAARWKQPRMRAMLGLLALAAGGLLALQAALEFRDLLAASWPASRALLEPACRIAGCRVEALRRIDGLAVHSSSLVRVAGTDRMGLTVVLHNRDHVELMLPALELVLNDAQGRTLARRVLRPAEMGAQRETLAAGAQLPLSATLGIGGLPVVGYTIEIFYP